jgi:hypothetical protein
MPLRIKHGYHNNLQSQVQLPSCLVHGQVGSAISEAPDLTTLRTLASVKAQVLVGAVYFNRGEGEAAIMSTGWYV